MCDKITLLLVTLVSLVAALVIARLLRPPAQEDRPSLPPSMVRRCETCERWQGTRAVESAVCTWTKKAEERTDSCSRHVTRRAL